MPDAKHSNKLKGFGQFTFQNRRKCHNLRSKDAHKMNCATFTFKSCFEFCIEVGQDSRGPYSSSGVVEDSRG